MRANDGTIGVVEKYNSNPNSEKKYSVIWLNGMALYYCTRKDIAKHSTNVIDLLKRGDYVNGKFVWDVFEKDGKKVVKVDCMRRILL